MINDLDVDFEDDDSEHDTCYYCGAEFNEEDGVFECDCAERGVGETQRCEYCGDEVQGIDHSFCKMENKDED